ncbi:hypothetical protein ACFLYD_07815 [Chloroflexota bacterium]
MAPEELAAPQRPTEEPSPIAAPLPTLTPSESKGEEEAETRHPVAVASQEDFLSGIQDMLPLAALVSHPRATSAEASCPGEDRARDGGAVTSQAGLFAEIVTPPRKVAAEAIGQHWSPGLPVVSRWVIYAVLISAVTLPLIVKDWFPSLLREPWLQSTFFSGSRTMEPTPAVAALYQQIESLSRGAPVLVAFDYDPATLGEMDLLARATVRHLMDRDARVLAVSLLPAGSATAQNLLEVVAAEHPGYSEGYGQRYANLGYLPGQAPAVRLLGQSLQTALPVDFYGNPVRELVAMQGLASIQDFDLIVELAVEQNTLRWWVEQASTPFDVPLGAGVSASVEPLARPYYETPSRQLVGLVGGVTGAAMYETLLGGERPEGAMVARLDAQMTGYLAFVLIILIGNGVYLMRRAARKEP